MPLGEKVNISVFLFLTYKTDIPILISEVAKEFVNNPKYNVNARHNCFKC